MTVRILVVEDERRIAAFIKRGLEEEHYAVDAVYDGEEALELAGQAIAQDRGFADAYLARGSTVVRRRRGDAWFAEFV